MNVFSLILEQLNSVSLVGVENIKTMASVIKLIEEMESVSEEKGIAEVKDG